MGNWKEWERFGDRIIPVFNEGILKLATRLIKWAVAEHDLPSDRFPIHSLRSGGATCLYHSGADLEYIRRFGRWRSSTFSIYLHFDGKLLRKLPSCLMDCEGLTTQFRVCNEGNSRAEFGANGDMARVTQNKELQVGNVGAPASLPQEKRTGSNMRRAPRRRPKSRRRKSTARIPDEPKAQIYEETMIQIRNAKVLWDTISHPEYESEDDGLGDVMNEGALNFDIQGRVFVDEAFVSRNFRLARTYRWTCGERVSKPVRHPRVKPIWRSIRKLIGST